MEKTLYISDLDGTLLNENARISEQSMRIINHLLDNGIHFSVATARAYSSTRAITNGLKITDPIIIYNGAFIMDYNLGDILYANYFSLGEINALREIFNEAGVFPLVCSMNGKNERISFLKGSMSQTTLKYYELMLSHGDKRFKECDTQDELYSGNIFYFKFTGEYEDFCALNEKINLDNRFIAILSNPVYNYERYWFEIMPKSTSKAEGVKKLKQMKGYERVVCFGDALNDVEMFKIANEGYAVKNACDELKAVATAIIESNSMNGVANHLYKNIKMRG